MINPGLRTRLAAARHAPGFWAIVDQGIVSIGTFVVTLILARTISASDFGVFGVLMGLLVTAVTVHTSLIGVPLMVLTAKSTRQHELAGLSLALAAFSTALFSVLLAFAVLIVGRPGLLPAVALALVGAEIQETLRRSLMARLQFRRAIAGDALSYLGQAAGVSLLASGGGATVGQAFAVMGISSLAASALQFWQVRPSFGAPALRRDAMRPFWRLGRDLVVVNGIGAATIQALIWTVGAVLGVHAVGQLQALLIVVGPTNALMLVVNSLVTTHAAHIRESDPIRRRQLELGVARHYGVIVGIPLLLYCAALFVAPGPALTLFFGADSTYRALAGDLRVFVFFSLGLYSYFVVSGVLNARQDTSTLLRAQVGSALVLLVAVPMTVAWSLRGAVAAAVLSAATRATLAIARARSERG